MKFYISVLSSKHSKPGTSKMFSFVFAWICGMPILFAGDLSPDMFVCMRAASTVLLLSRQWVPQPGITLHPAALSRASRVV